MIVGALAVASAGQSADGDIHRGHIDWSHKSDGDTFRIAESQKKIRLWGIDAPESDQLCFTAIGVRVPCGAMAQAALREIVGEKEVVCTEKDVSYGRFVSQCMVDGIDLNAALAERGMVIAYLTYTKVYRDRAIEACKQKTGIWAFKFEVPSAFRGRGYPTDGRADDIANNALRGDTPGAAACTRQSYL